MRILKGSEAKKALELIVLAARVAMDSPCDNRKCGSVIEKDDEVVGKGYNSPAGKKAWCDTPKDFYDEKVTDKTCCSHAETRSVINGLIKDPDKVNGAIQYFSECDENGNPVISGEPYCTICSKMNLDVGIAEFVLLKKEGIVVYTTEEYDDISRNYGN